MPSNNLLKAISTYKQAGLSADIGNALSNMDPTLRNSFLGAGVGGIAGAGLGIFNGLAGPSRPRIDSAMADSLLAHGISQRLVDRLSGGHSIDDDDKTSLRDSGIDLEEIAPLPGYLSNLLGNSAAGGLGGLALGALAGGGITEAARLATPHFAFRAPEAVPDLIADPVVNIGKELYNASPRSMQWDVVRGSGLAPVVDAPLDIYKKLFRKKSELSSPPLNKQSGIFSFGKYLPDLIKKFKGSVGDVASQATKAVDKVPVKNIAGNAPDLPLPPPDVPYANLAPPPSKSFDLPLPPPDLPYAIPAPPPSKSFNLPLPPPDVNPYSNFIKPPARTQSTLAELWGGISNVSPRVQILAMTGAGAPFVVSAVQHARAKTFPEPEGGWPSLSQDIRDRLDEMRSLQNPPPWWWPPMPRTTPSKQQEKEAPPADHGILSEKAGMDTSPLNKQAGIFSFGKYIPDLIKKFKGSVGDVASQAPKQQSPHFPVPPLPDPLRMHKGDWHLSSADFEKEFKRELDTLQHPIKSPEDYLEQLRQAGYGGATSDAWNQLSAAEKATLSRKMAFRLRYGKPPDVPYANLVPPPPSKSFDLPLPPPDVNPYSNFIKSPARTQGDLASVREAWASIPLWQKALGFYGTTIPAIMSGKNYFRKKLHPLVSLPTEEEPEDGWSASPFVDEMREGLHGRNIGNRAPPWWWPPMPRTTPSKQQEKEGMDISLPATASIAGLLGAGYGAGKAPGGDMLEEGFRGGIKGTATGLGAYAGDALVRALSDAGGLDNAALRFLAQVSGIGAGALGGNLLSELGLRHFMGKSKDRRYDLSDEEIRALEKSSAPNPLLTTLDDDEDEDEREKELAAGIDPGLLASLAAGAGGLGALGTAYGIASDDQVARIAASRRDFNPKAFGDRSLLPPNTTDLTYYNRILSPGAQISPFGKPIGDALVALRSNDTLMDLIGVEGYRLKTRKAQQGLSGAAHYRMFAGGPVPAYIHQMKAKYHDVKVPAFGTSQSYAPDFPDATRSYPDWMGEKLEDFVNSEMGERINPYEFSTEYLPHEEQVKLMQDFHASLSPAVQEYRQNVEDLSEEQYTAQTENYLPRAEMIVNMRDILKDVGITAGGAGAGGLAGNYLHRLFGGEKGTGRNIATAAGAGLGGAASFLGGTARGRGYMIQLGDLLKKLITKKASVSMPGIVSIKQAGRSKYAEEGNNQ